MPICQIDDFNLREGYQRGDLKWLLCHTCNDHILFICLPQDIPLTWSDGSPVIHQSWNVMFRPNNLMNISLYQIEHKRLEELQYMSDASSSVLLPLGTQPAFGNEAMCGLTIHVPLSNHHYEWFMIPCDQKTLVTPVCQIQQKNRESDRGREKTLTVIHQLGLAFVKVSSTINHSIEPYQYTCHHGWALYQQRCHILLKFEDKVTRDPCSSVAPGAAQSRWYGTKEWNEVITHLLLNYSKNHLDFHNQITVIQFRENNRCVLAKIHPIFLRGQKVSQFFPAYLEVPVIQSVISQ